MPRSPEQHGGGEHFMRPRASNESLEAPKRHERTAYNPEKERRETSSARSEALEQALETKHYEEPDTPESGPKGPAVAPKSSLKTGFVKTMSRVQSELPLPQRVFSKIIHSPVIEKTSDVIGSTVARPDAILSGSVCALLLTGVLYFTARYFGFSLSGSETMAAFAAGWLIGILFDLLKGAFKRS